MEHLISDTSSDPTAHSGAAVGGHNYEINLIVFHIIDDCFWNVAENSFRVKPCGLIFKLVSCLFEILAGINFPYFIHFANFFKFFHSGLCGNE